MASPSTRNPSPSTPGVRSADRSRERQVRYGRGAAEPTDDSGRVAQAVAAAGQRGARITWRLVAILVVFALLTVMYANSLRVYFSQQRAIAEVKAQVEAAQRTVDDLYDQLQRWQDPAYVRAQARERLGWVVPGEVGFRVIGVDGKVLGGGVSVTSPTSQPPEEPAEAWWDRLTGSILAADDPVPVPGSGTTEPPR